MKKSQALSFLLLFISGTFSGQSQTAGSSPANTTVYHPTRIIQPAWFDLSPPMRDKSGKQTAVKPKSEREVENSGNPMRERYGNPPKSLAPDPVLQKENGTYLPLTPVITKNFEGTANLDWVYPPDTQGDVGLSHYVQVVNSNWAVYSKTGTLLQGPDPLSNIWTGIPAPWNGTNSGDPVVLYDQQAQRWIISQFAVTYPNYAELVAVSQTSDPTGSWYRYVYAFGTVLPDYPKLGIWPDGYYLSTIQLLNANSGDGIGVAAMDREKMLAGDPSASMQYIDLPPSFDGWTMLPSDWDGQIAPPAGAPNPFMFVHDWSVNRTIKLYSFHVDWANPSNTSFTETQTLTPQTFDPQLCTATRERCIPQPGTTVKLEAVGGRLMYRLQYRNFPFHQSIVANHTVDVDGTGHAGIRWYEFRNTGSGWSIYQQGTYSPDASHRWLGSIAMNDQGDIALGYSVSDGTTIYPSIRFTGRKSTDPLGQMSLAEQTIQDGSGSQTGSECRWGDYAMMSVDPSNDQNFWFTSEYIQTTGVSDWHTRIASFRISNAPTVNTTAATSITTTSAQLNGTLYANGLSTSYYFQYGTTTSYGSATNIMPAGSGSFLVMLNASVTGLTSGTTYHYRLAGVNNEGTAFGSDKTFTPGAAVITTTEPSSVTYYNAVSGGIISADGGAAVSSRGVCWSRNPAPTVLNCHSENGSGTGTYTVTMADLPANTLIYLRAYAVNATGTWYGDELSFTTGCAPFTLPFTEGFGGTSLPSCWSMVDHTGNWLVWKFGTITNGYPNPALTGNYAYLPSNSYGNFNTENADLISPTLDCSSFTNVTLQFAHYLKACTSTTATVSVSIDDGNSWTAIQTFTTTSASNPALFNQLIPAAAGQAQVKFKWNLTATWCYYWAFNDVHVTGTQSGHDISGNFYYNNTVLTPLDNLRLNLRQNGIRKDSLLTSAAGYFKFDNKSNGTYIIEAVCNKPWSGVNATDATKVQRHFAGLEIITEPVKLQAADVNASGSINATDAVKIKRRFAGLDNSFAAGDWTFAKPLVGGNTVTLLNSDLSQNFYGLCVGDVNGSYVPLPGMKPDGSGPFDFSRQPANLYLLKLKVDKTEIKGKLIIQ